MLNTNEHLIGYFDLENDLSASRVFSLENTQGFTVLAQGNIGNLDTITINLWAQLPIASDTELASLVATATSEGTADGGLTTTYSAPSRWVLIRSDDLVASTFGDGNPGWAITDTLVGYKAVKVTVSNISTETGFFLSVFATSVNLPR